jgi:hypothetical protein
MTSKHPAKDRGDEVPEAVRAIRSIKNEDQSAADGITSSDEGTKRSCRNRNKETDTNRITYRGLSRNVVVGAAVAILMVSGIDAWLLWEEIGDSVARRLIKE